MSISTSSTSNTNSSTNPALQSLLASKRAELDSLIALRDLSAELTTQISQLGAKLQTLDSGFEAVAEVMANWGAVVRVLGMVGSEMGRRQQAESGDGDGDGGGEDGGKGLGTVVRIPVDGVE